MDARAELATKLYGAFRSRDWGALEELFAQDVELGLSGRSPVAGTYRGRADAVGALRSLVDEMDGTIGPVREDTRDVCTSDHHVVLIEWLQAIRGGRTARFHVHLVSAVEGGRVLRAFASFDSQYDFDELWA